MVDVSRITPLRVRPPPLPTSAAATPPPPAVSRSSPVPTIGFNSSPAAANPNIIRSTTDPFARALEVGQSLPMDGHPPKTPTRTPTSAFTPRVSAAALVPKSILPTPLHPSLVQQYTHAPRMASPLSQSSSFSSDADNVDTEINPIVLPAAKRALSTDDELDTAAEGYPEEKRRRTTEGAGARSLAPERRKVFDLAHPIYTTRLATEFAFPDNDTKNEWSTEAWVEVCFQRDCQLTPTDSEIKLVC